MLQQKAIYFPKQKTLVAADVHLGKSGHFRKAGLAVPAELSNADLIKLDDVFRVCDVESFIILGDLFHADLNSDWEKFKRWRSSYSSLNIELVKGNHDVLHSSIYDELRIISHNSLPFCNLNLIHSPSIRSGYEGQYSLCGHVHPAVRMRGRGKQSIALPCFYFGSSFGILPAFGEFTGRHLIMPKPDDAIFVVTDSDVVRV